MNIKLYELSESFINVNEMLENQDSTEEETTKLLKNALDNINIEFENKAENIAKLIKELDLTTAAIAEEERRLSSKKKTLNNNIEFLKRYLESNMIEVDKKKFKTNLFSFNIQKNVPSLKVENEDNIPEDYFKIEKKLNKKDLLKDMKENGVEIEGVEIIQTESLRIR